MPNVVKKGFKPWGSLSRGKGASIAEWTYEVASGYGTALAVGDPVRWVGDGTVEKADATGDATSGATSANTSVLGVITGLWRYSATDGGRSVEYLAASHTYQPTTRGSATATKATIAFCTPDAIFSIAMDDADSANHDAASELYGLIGANVDHTFSVAADATRLESAVELDVSTANTTSTLLWRVIDIVQEIGQDGLSASARALVVCNWGQLPHYLQTGR